MLQGATWAFCQNAKDRTALTLDSDPSTSTTKGLVGEVNAVLSWKKAFSATWFQHTVNNWDPLSRAIMELNPLKNHLEKLVNLTKC